MVGQCGGVFDYREQLKERLRCCPETPAPTEPAAEAETVPVPASRWTLRQMQATFEWLADYSLAGISLFVRASGIQLRQGRPQ